MECTQKVGISGNLYLWNGITRSNPWIGDGNDPRLGLTSLHAVRSTEYSTTVLTVLCTSRIQYVCYCYQRRELKRFVALLGSSTIYPWLDQDAAQFLCPTEPPSQTPCHKVTPRHSYYLLIWTVAYPCSSPAVRNIRTEGFEWSYPVEYIHFFCTALDDSLHRR